MSKTVLVLGLFCGINLTVAAGPSGYTRPVKTDYVFMDQEFFQTELTNSKKIAVNRKLAQVDRVDYATAFEDDFKNLSAELIGGKTWKAGKQTSTVLPGVRTDSDLASLVNKFQLEKNFEDLSIQSKWVAAQIAALKPWRGFLTRARPLIENSKAPFVHSFIVSWLRSVNAGINAFVPTPEWKAGFDYAAKPYVGMPGDITSEFELYLFVRDELLPTLTQLSTRLNSIAYVKDTSGKRISNPDFRPFYFDNKLIYSTSRFVAEQDRFVLLDKAELHTFLSNVSLSISSLQVALAYDWTGLLGTVNSLANVMGFNNLLSANPDKMTAAKRVAKFKQSGRLFLLIPKNDDLPEGGTSWTKSAYPWFKEGVRHGRLAWSYAKHGDSRSRNEYPLLDPRALVPFTRIIDTSFENINHLIEGDGVRSSLVEGEEVQVNFSQFFTNPPADLKAFLATDFDNGPRTLTEASTKRKYRNYNYGNPKGWDLKAYRPYFPNIEQSDVPKAVRILSQSWGAGILGAAMMPVLF